MEISATVTAGDLVKLTGIPARTLRTWATAGVLVAAGPRGQYLLGPSLRGIVGHLRRSGSSGDARTRLLEAQAAYKQTQHEQLTRTLVSREDVAEGWLTLAAMFKAELLSLPGRLASELCRERHPGEARQILDGDCRRALNRLSAELQAQVARQRGEVT